MASKQQEAWRRPSSSSVALGAAVALFLPAEWRPITRTLVDWNAGLVQGSPHSYRARHRFVRRLDGEHDQYRGQHDLELNKFTAR